MPFSWQGNPLVTAGLESSLLWLLRAISYTGDIFVIQLIPVEHIPQDAASAQLHSTDLRGGKLPELDNLPYKTSSRGVLTLLDENR